MRKMNGAAILYAENTT